MAATDVRVGDGLLIQPLPWHAAHHGDGMWAVYDSNDIIECSGLLRDEAEFIVTACNSHHDLVAALKECSFRLGCLVAAMGDFTEINAAALDAAQAAIAKAEGR
jgi:hypothetical protein